VVWEGINSKSRSRIRQKGLQIPPENIKTVLIKYNLLADGKKIVDFLISAQSYVFPHVKAIIRQTT